VDYIFHKLSCNTKHVSTPFEPMVNYCSKWAVIQYSCIFWRAPICIHVAKTTEGLKGRVPKKKFILPIKSWIFTFFQMFFLRKIYHGSTWCNFQCNSSNLSVKSLIFFKKIHKFHGVGVLGQYLHQQKEF
jgi:hypothetical protein